MLKNCKIFISSLLLLLQIAQICVAETNLKNSSDLYHGPGCDKMKFIGADNTCSEVGKFGIPGECTRYMDCVEDAEGKTVSRKAYCPKGFNFDGDDCAPSSNQLKCYQTDCILVSNSSEEESMEERGNITHPIVNGTAITNHMPSSVHNSANESMASLTRKLISLKRAPKLSVNEESNWHMNNLTETETTTTTSAVAVALNETSEEIGNSTQAPNKTQAEVPHHKKPMEIPVLVQHLISHADSASTPLAKNEIINTTATTFITTISTGNVSVTGEARTPFKATVSMVPLINGKVSKVTVNGLNEDYVVDADLNSTTTSTTTTTTDTPTKNHTKMNDDTPIEFPEPKAAVVDLTKNSTLSDATTETETDNQPTENDGKIQKPTNSSTIEKARIETPLNDTSIPKPHEGHHHDHDLPMQSTTQIMVEESSTETTMKEVTSTTTTSVINPATETTTTQPPSLKNGTRSKSVYSDAVLSTANANENNAAEVLKARNEPPLNDSSMAKHEGHDPSQTQTHTKPKTMESRSGADRAMMLNALPLMAIAIFNINSIIF